jgi:hypothetical protein
MGRVSSHPYLIQRILRKGIIAEFAAHVFRPARLAGGSAWNAQETGDHDRHPEGLGAVPKAAGASQV